MLKQGLHQKLLQKLSPQQIQLMKLLQVPTASLEQRIKEELENNPALEEGQDVSNLEDPYQASSDESEHTEDTPYEDNENFEKTEEEISLSDYMSEDDDPYYKTHANNTSSDDEQYEAPITQGTTFHEHLMTQISFNDISEKELAIANTVIGNIDDDGYLRRDIDSMCDDLAFSQGISTTVDEISKVLEMVQDLEPAGVGARDLRECLLIQLERLSKRESLEARIVNGYLDDLLRRRFPEVARRLGEFGDRDHRRGGARRIAGLRAADVRREWPCGGRSASSWCEQPRDRDGAGGCHAGE